LGWARRRDFDLGLAHGSVDLALVGRVLGIPTVQMQDYEFAGRQRQISWGVARRVLAPDAIPVERLEAAGAQRRKLFLYPGLKEDYYLADFRPDGAVLGDLGIGSEDLIAVVRPPPDTSEYHERNTLYDQVLDRLAASEGVVAVVIPRTTEQADRLRRRGGDRLVVPDRAIDAQSLIAYADLVVSAGGTMNREAVALGTPVYTIFTGRLGAVDEQLISAGLLRPLTEPAALELSKRQAGTGPLRPRDPQLLVDAILSAPG
jgi:predicted glycosyltransferase